MEASIGGDCPDEKRVIFGAVIEKIEPSGAAALRYTPAGMAVRHLRIPGASTMPSPSPDVVDLAEDLRSAVGAFVRIVRYDTDTPRSAGMDTLELLERAGPVNIATLAQIRNVKHQSMRLVTAQLEEDGLVEREPDPEDGRSVLFAVTARGRQRLRDGRAARTAHIAGLIAARLTADDRADLRTAVRLLDRLAAGGH
jgi:DNA-binding MarR family transcriptional regulator